MVCKTRKHKNKKHDLCNDYYKYARTYRSFEVELIKLLNFLAISFTSLPITSFKLILKEVSVQITHYNLLDFLSQDKFHACWLNIIWLYL